MYMHIRNPFAIHDPRITRARGNYLTSPADRLVFIRLVHAALYASTYIYTCVYMYIMRAHAYIGRSYNTIPNAVRKQKVRACAIKRRSRSTRAPRGLAVLCVVTLTSFFFFVRRTRANGSSPFVCSRRPCGSVLRYFFFWNARFLL